jgi:hemoglobin
MDKAQINVYEFVGGAATFWALVEAFYQRVEADPRLRPMFPENLEEGKRWQALFLIQYWGGPTYYHAERGHPRLRMRHMPYRITPEAREAWLAHMLAAIDEVGIAEPARSMMREYFINGSAFMINSQRADV